MINKSKKKRPIKRKGRVLSKIVVVAIWSSTVIFLIVASIEVSLTLRSEFRRRQAKPSPLRTLAEAYFPFATQHINPYYMFFFPFDRTQRMAMNNKICTVTPEGFRGPGLEKSSGLKLAFLLGGSAAFGHYASSDSTTITGFLNNMQTKYHFINAGVPSWNSYQELCRLANQILDYQPDIVIAYDGGNDIALVEWYWHRGIDYTAGTPESFDDLYALVGDIRAGRVKVPKAPIYRKLLPRVSRYSTNHWNKLKPYLFSKSETKAVIPPVPESLIQECVHRYLSNLTHMQAMTQKSGGRFISIFQPIGGLHKNAPENKKLFNFRPSYQRFRDLAFSSKTLLDEHLDYSTMFESIEGELPWIREPAYPDLDDELIFIDSFHLYDRGNRIVAEKILDYLSNSDDI